MRRRLTASTYVNYQERAKMFSVGDSVSPYGYQNSVAGKVVAVYPGIGMVDVETSRGTQRLPVEELQKWDQDGVSVPPETVSVPGGVPTTAVTASAKRVALYWADKDRKYRMCRQEISLGKPTCPKCGSDFPLQKTNYKRRGGKSESLLGCKGCLFLIKLDDIIGGE